MKNNLTDTNYWELSKRISSSKSKIIFSEIFNKFLEKKKNNLSAITSGPHLLGWIKQNYCVW